MKLFFAVPFPSAEQLQRNIAPIAFALLLSANMVTIYSHGLFGLGSWFTGGYLATLIALSIALGYRQWGRMLVADYLMAGLAFFCGLSVSLHPPTDLRQIVHLALSVLAYLAARGFGGSMRQPGFGITLALVIAIGTASTIVALFGEDHHGKPLIFGFDHGSDQLVMLLAVLIFVLVCSRARLPLIAIMTAPLVAIFAASQVRFTLMALLATVAAGAALAPARRFRMATLLAVLIIAAVIGFAGRASLTLEFLKYADESFGHPIPAQSIAQPLSGSTSSSPGPHIASVIAASRCPEINLNNTIDMRKRLYEEAFALLPSAEITGIGLGKFAELSCVNAEVHNSLLQMAIEFGIPAGIFFLAAIVAVCSPIFGLARKNDSALLALLSLSFAILVDFAHGRVPDDVFLFTMLGYGSAQMLDSHNLP